MTKLCALLQIAWGYRHVTHNQRSAKDLKRYEGT